MTQDLDIKGTFKVLFEGNRSALGAEGGGCLRIEQPWMWSQFIEAHLTGEGQPIGVYPMVARYDVRYGAFWGVYWGCIDFDEGEEESWVHAKNVHLALQNFGVVGWIERSRSKGYHVWVFADQWVPAVLMRKALLAACQVVDAPMKEINPKQVELKPGQLGNYVRLPYPGCLDAKVEFAGFTSRAMMQPNRTRIGLQDFVSRAFSSRVGIEGLEFLAERYVAPERPIRRRDWSGLPRTSEGIDGFVKWVAELPEGNRNMGLYWAAMESLDQGVEDLEPLVMAGIDAGLSEAEASRTVESARRSR